MRFRKSIYACVGILIFTTACEYQIRYRRADSNVQNPVTPTYYSQPFVSVVSHNSGSHSGGCIAVDPIDGSRFIASLLNGNVTFGSNTYDSNFTNDIVVFKQDKNGVLIWSKHIAGDMAEQLTFGLGSCMTFAGGKAFLSFSTNSNTIDVGGTPVTSDGSSASIIVGFDSSNGNPSVIQTFGSLAASHTNLSLASSGNIVYWAGYTADASVPGPAGSCGSFCVTYGALNAVTGIKLWSRRWGGGSSQAYGITVGTNNDLYLSGSFTGNGNDPGIGSPIDSTPGTTQEAFITKVSTLDGTPSWVKTVRSSNGVTNSFTAMVANGLVSVAIMTTYNSVDIEGLGNHVAQPNGSIIVHYDLDGNFVRLTDLPLIYSLTRMKYDPISQSIWFSCLGILPPEIPFMVRMKTDGTIEKIHSAETSGGSQFYGMSFDLSPSTTSVVSLNVFQASITLNGSVYTSNLGPQTMIVELK